MNLKLEIENKKHDNLSGIIGHNYMKETMRGPVFTT